MAKAAAEADEKGDGDKGFTLVLNRSTASATDRFDVDDKDGITLRAKADAKREELVARPAKPNIEAAEATAVQIVCRARPLLDHEREQLGCRIQGATAASHAQFDYEVRSVPRANRVRRPRPCAYQRARVQSTSGARILARANALAGDMLSWCARVAHVPARSSPLPAALPSRAQAVVAHGREVFCLSEERKIGAPTGEIAVTPFELHGAFGSESTTEEVYARSVEPLVRLALGGGLGTVIAYGQTGSGKTHTMQGLQHLAAQAMLGEGVGQSKGLWVSFFENSGDRCLDLLNESAPLALRDDGSGAVSVVGLTERSVGTAAAFAALVAGANERRATKPTASNDTSSRSHAICTLRLGGGSDGGADGPSGRLQLVDLAGSERREDAVSHDAERLAEMRDINSSLGTLKECIRAHLRRATDEPSAHVPYRNSKLTMLLKAAFEHSRSGADAHTANGGSAARSAVCFIAHISPLRSQAKHTTNTLDYAAQMLLATMAERQRAQFDEVEKWSAKKLTAWVAQLEGGKYAHCAHAFARSSGKALTVEYLPDVAQWVVAAGGTAEEAEAIYNAFRQLHKKAKAAKKRQP